MTVAAQLRGVMRNREPGVIESRTQPAGCRVTGLAGGWETRSSVVRIGRARVIRLVARITIGRGSREHSANVATRAGDGDVGAR